MARLRHAHADGAMEHALMRRPTAVPSAGLSTAAAQVLTLQRLAGNAAVVALLDRPSVQRTGCGGACGCGGMCGGEHEEVPVQRKCPDDGGPWRYEYDGCSLPAALVGFFRTQRGEMEKDNPAGGHDTEFARHKPTTTGGVACDRHDECYQSCGADRDACDYRMYQDMLEICRKSTASREVRTSCKEWAELYLAGLRKGAEGAFKGRQKQACGCSKGSKTLSPAMRYPPRGMLKDKKGEYPSWLEYRLSTGWLPLSAYKVFLDEQEYGRYIGRSGLSTPAKSNEGKSLLKMR